MENMEITCQSIMKSKVVLNDTIFDGVLWCLIENELNELDPVSCDSLLYLFRR